MSVDLFPIEVIQFLEARQRLWAMPPRDRYRACLAMKLQALIAAAERIGSTFEADPDNDDEMGVAGSALGAAIDQANAMLVRYRGSRDCQGEA